MFGPAKRPKDRFRYAKATNSQPLTRSAKPGRYAYVVDPARVLHAVPDALHAHPRILGGALPVLFAGDLEISSPGVVESVTNCSGTFQFTSRRSLCDVARLLRTLGFQVKQVIWFPTDGSWPKKLRCGSSRKRQP